MKLREKKVPKRLTNLKFDFQMSVADFAAKINKINLKTLFAQMQVQNVISLKFQNNIFYICCCVFRLNF